MTCAICRHGTTRPGRATVALARGGAAVVFTAVPAEVCDNCGEEYVDSATATRLLDIAEGAVRDGVRVDVREYLAA